MSVEFSLVTSPCLAFKFET